MENTFDHDELMRTIRSTSSIISEASTFYSAPSIFPKADDPKTGNWMEAVLGQTNRTDSGFEECLGSEVATSHQMQSATTWQPHSTAMLDTPTADDGPTRPTTQPRSTEGAYGHRSRADSGLSTFAVVPDYAVASINSSRRSSVTQTSARAVHETRHSSRRSSFRHPSSASAGLRTRPMMLTRRSSTLSSKFPREDPYVVHQRAREIFQLLGSSSSDLPSCDRGHQEPLRPATRSGPLLTLGFEQKAASEPPGRNYNAKASQAATDIHVPCTIIDWTAPGTRRREYAKIDRSTRGLRGLWRRISPRWCRASGHLSFYESDNDDTRSVRRYRLDIADYEDEKQRTGRVRAVESRPSWSRSRMTWSCFSSRDGKRSAPS